MSIESESNTRLFAHANFVTSVADPARLPRPTGAEIAFAGRSNAGKSSAINTLVGEKRLAFVSKTPGRTQLINYFELRNGAYLTDLPGYGYADVPPDVQRRWGMLLERYLATREALAGLVLVMDARRPLTKLDLQMLAWFRPRRLPVHCLLTKADKLSRLEQTQTLRNTRDKLAAYGAANTAQLFSSLKRTGIDEAESVLGSWLDGTAGNFR